MSKTQQQPYREETYVGSVFHEFVTARQKQVACSNTDDNMKFDKGQTREVIAM